MPFAKLHLEILGDPKLLRAARLGGRGLELTPWLIAFAKAADDGGNLSIGGEPADPADIAVLIPNCNKTRVKSCLFALETAGVLLRNEEGMYSFAAWEVRAVDKPSDNKEQRAARQRAHRERKRQRRQEDTQNASHARNALPVTPSNAPEVEVEVEVERKSKSSAARDTSRDNAAHAGANTHDHLAGFADAWSIYPKRSGGNPRHEAEKQWRARRRSGVTAEAMIAGTRRYVAWCTASGKVGTEYVMQARTFLGPAKRFEDEWEVPAEYADPTRGEWRGASDRVAAEESREDADELWLEQRRAGGGS